MATEQQVQTLTATLEAVAKETNKDLVKRSEWGAITFEKAAADLKRLRDVTGYLRTLPLDYIPENIAPHIENAVKAVQPTLASIDAFTITTGNPGPQRDAFVTQLHSQVEGVLAHAGQWIPFLAYQQGDVAANIQRMANAAEEGRRMVEAAKSDVEKKSAEITAIIVAAREASASAGAAVFTADFENESKSLERAATNWLVGAGLLALATLGTASGFLWLARQPVSPSIAAESAPAAPAPKPPPAPGVASPSPAGIASANQAMPLPAVATMQAQRTAAAPSTGDIGVSLVPSTPAVLSASQVAQVIGAKLIMLTVLLTAATWCGRNYKALKHLAVVNRHRALSLKTMKAFSAAASDELTKNAVLLEATRTIFTAGVTGYIDGRDTSDEGSSLKIVEIAKSLGSSKPSASA